MKWIRIEDKEPPKEGTPFLGYDGEAKDMGKIYGLIFRPGVTYEVKNLKSFLIRIVILKHLAKVNFNGIQRIGYSCQINRRIRDGMDKN